MISEKKNVISDDINKLVERVKEVVLEIAKGPVTI